MIAFTAGGELVLLMCRCCATFTYDASGNQQVLRTPAGARAMYSWTHEKQLALIENSYGTRITHTWVPVTRSADEFRAKTQSGATTTRHFWGQHKNLWLTHAAALMMVECTLNPQPYAALISQRRARRVSVLRLRCCSCTPDRECDASAGGGGALVGGAFCPEMNLIPWTVPIAVRREASFQVSE